MPEIDQWVTSADVDVFIRGTDILSPTFRVMDRGLNNTDTEAAAVDQELIFTACHQAKRRVRENVTKRQAENNKMHESIRPTIRWIHCLSGCRWEWSRGLLFF